MKQLKGLNLVEYRILGYNTLILQSIFNQSFTIRNEIKVITLFPLTP